MSQPGKTLLYQNPVSPDFHPNRLLTAWWLHLPGRHGGGGLRMRDLKRSHHGSLTNMGPSSWRGAAGRPGGFGSLAFDSGSTQYVTVSNAGDMNTDNYTVSGWFRPDSDAANMVALFAGNSVNAIGFTVYFTSAGSGSKIRMSVWNGSVESYAESASSYEVGRWVHVTGVQAGVADRRIYVNGVLDGTNADIRSGSDPGVQATLRVGRHSGSPFSGLADDVRFCRGTALSAGQVWRVYEDSRRGHPDTLRWLPNRTWFVPAAGGQTVNLGLVSETDLSQAVSRLKTLAVGLNAETGLSQPVIPGREYGLGTTSETDLSQAVSSAKESALGLNSETDLPQGVSPVRSYGLGPVSETDLSLAVGTMKSLLLGLNAETDSPQGVGTRKSLGTGSAAETDLAQTVTRYSPGTLGVVTETDLSLGVSSQKELGTGLVTETDTSLASSPVRAYGLGLGSETDGALSLGQTAKERGLGLVAEADAALGSTIPQEVEVGLVSSVHAALSVSPARRVTLGFVTEADGTFSLGFLKEKTVGMVAETDSARAVTVIGGTLVVGPYYVDAVQVHRAGAVAVQATRAGAVAVQAGVPT